MKRRPPDRDKERGSRYRCAIYTRKSSEEGLDQDFNSLDAQREACEAYIKSQLHEGWQALPENYDDGGFSGGTVERPAFRRLIEAIEAGSVDAVVVYKVDRLTRSLHDFAKIVEVFDRKGVSFVSITQQFNTTTSMGRLTLNMLLSFAQFEREVTGERIRDKIAASKRKGMWMGGVPPLGYDVDHRKLVVNVREAETVRDIFRHYIDVGSVHALKNSLDRDRVLSKVRINQHGRRSGGHSFARGALYKLLQNRLYRGEIVHKGTSYPGEHAAIVPPEIWDPVQAMLAEHRVERTPRSRASEPSVLAGLIYDDAGQRMTPTHANKQGRRYRYYVSQKLTTETRRELPRGRRVPARDLERLVEDRLRQFLVSEGEIFDALSSHVRDASDRMRLVAAAAQWAKRWDDLGTMSQRSLLRQLVQRVDLASQSLTLSINAGRLSAVLSTAEPSKLDAPATSVQADGAILTLTVPARLKRTGMEMRLLIDGAGSGARTKSDHSLCRLVAQAYRYQAVMLNSRGKTLNEIAAEAGVTRSHFRRVLRLSFLAPDIVQSILRDRHPIELNAERLAKNTVLRLSWDEQRAQLGFD